jgi:CRP/FNR family transcriptional regulator, cyclic AMP receptor protein
MSQDIATQLAGTALFRGVDVQDREALISLMNHKKFGPGDGLFEKGSPGDTMYIILSGRVRIYTYDAEGNPLTIRYLEETFGEFSMLDSRPRSASAAADGPLEVLILHRDDFMAYVKERPLVGLAMMRQMVERVRYTTTYLQRVLDAVEQLAQGNYEGAVERVSESPTDADTTDAEIQELVASFISMVRDVQAREEILKRQIAPAPNDTESPLSRDT